MPPAARLLLGGQDSPPLELRRHLVLTVATAELADGLLQWPGTRSFIVARLGPTALAIDEETLEAFQERLKEIGVSVTG